jgi:putative hydrolase of HD superfamily
MITKGEPPLAALSGRDLAPLIEAYFEINQLKQLYRQGWLRRGVPPERCESVAEHVFGMALLGWWIADEAFPELDRDKIIRMTLAHELGEVYAGDIIPADQVPAAEKERLEREALGRVVGKLPRGADYLALWEEYQAGQTGEARYVKQLDRLEMAFQAVAYQTQGLGAMDEFLASAAAALDDERLKVIFAQLAALVNHPGP